MKFNGIIENKLRLLEQKLGEIRSWKIKNYSEFSKSSLLYNAVERALQVSVEIMIDIAERILALNNQPPAPSSSKAVEKLVDLEILPNADNFIDMVRFRNFIVHRYEYIDKEILFSIITKKLHHFDEFIDYIRSYNWNENKDERLKSKDKS